MAIDVAQARAETPGCAHVVHFNNAGAALMPQPVLEALHDYLDLEARLGGYEAADARAEDLERFYTTAARLLNASPDEIAFAESATRAFQMVFYAFAFRPGERIVTCLAEYGSQVIAYLQQARRYGVEVVFAPNDGSGQVDVAALDDLLDERTRLIAVAHIPTGNGLVNPVHEVGRIARAHGIPFLLDATQSVGQLPVDVQAIGCDMLVTTGRKYLRGPRGTGLLYVRRDLLAHIEPPMLDLHAATLTSPSTYQVRPDARRCEAWEQNLAGKVALEAAMAYAMRWGLEAIREWVFTLGEMLRQRLRQVPGVRVTDVGAQKSGIVTFVPGARSAAEVRDRLRRQGIHVSVSRGSGSLVLFRELALREVVRASVHYYNTEEEVERFVAALRGML
ncbi:MAG TPA: aminotransferase class V-fold PLP-dependent enzyme [Anaerolineales bacterium]|nr:aminotransferase class V-fold PLP-dependent enzyme [Anaerolineales bacterium]